MSKINTGLIFEIFECAHETGRKPSSNLANI